MSGKNQKNPWKKKPDPGPPPPDISVRFAAASAKLHASVLKHVEYDSSSEEEELEQDKILEKLVINCKTDNVDALLGKTKEFLEQSFQSGAIVCLICIASVKRTQPIWSCETCYNAFHLFCIQRWAQDSVQQKSRAVAEQQADHSQYPVRDNSFQKCSWNCPKCRCEYEPEDIPKKYECFCKKQINPEYQPWLVPHTCGVICNKELKPNCGHRCHLLCHPGPCPSCPQLISMTCGCGQSPARPVRCRVHFWSCGRPCGRSLSCGTHACRMPCHEGPCEPCQETKLRPCMCKRQVSKRACGENKWQCDNVCGKLLPCGFHKCDKACLHEVCGPCPFSNLQACPCGATYADVQCPNEIPTCGSSCNKRLPCMQHICPDKCHRDECAQCVVLVEKTCRCGQHTKDLPCHKEFTCITKCKRIKACTNHRCSRKCCDGQCGPCDKPCGKTLACGKHRCQMACHSGLCYPCPLTDRVQCRCSGTFYIVPCGGKQRSKRPPKCSRNCKIPVKCDHVSQNIHKCHFGACPPCKQTCGRSLPCSHTCLAPCHTLVTLLPNSTKVEVKDLDCPPCSTPVAVWCFGSHEQLQWPCFSAKRVTCGRKCGRQLACGNHTCARECHEFPPDPSQALLECEQCSSACSAERPAGCSHPCKLPCHPPPCPPCQIFHKQPCHCGILQMYLKCHDMTSQLTSMSCNQQCIKNLKCGHRCSLICHMGDCSSTEECTKKTKVFCDCKRVKKLIPCNQVKQNETNVPCDDLCKAKMEEENRAKEEELKKKMEEESLKSELEMEMFERKFMKKGKKGRNNRVQDSKDTNPWYTNKLIVLPIFAGLLSVIVYVVCFN